MSNTMIIIIILAASNLLSVIYSAMASRRVKKSSVRERSFTSKILMKDMVVNGKGEVSLIIGTKEGIFKLPDIEESIVLFKQANYDNTVHLTFDDGPRSKTLSVIPLKEIQIT